MDNCYVMKAGGAQIKVPFERITAFPVQTNKNDSHPFSNQLEIEQLSEGLSRMTLKNKKKKQKIVKLQQKKDASQRKMPLVLQHGFAKKEERVVKFLKNMLKLQLLNKGFIHMYFI